MEKGTNLVKDINLGFTSSYVGFGNIVTCNDYIYFSANDGIHGQELWKSNGTQLSTVLVKDIYPGLIDFLIDFF